LHAINLKIDADFLRSQMGHASVICQDGWNFYFKVSLFGQFDKVFFSEAQFFDHFWVGAVFREVVKFHNVFFNECATFYESLFEDLVSFRKVIFENGANFTRSEFDGEAHFEIESKIEEIELKNELKRKEINFEGSEFTKKSDFELRNLDVFQLSFEGCKFCGEFLLQSENSTIRFLNLQSTVFSEIARFVPYSYYNHKKLVRDIKVEYTAFMKSAIFEIDFEKCPDFSKCYFLEKVFIKETWPEVIEKKVRPYEKEKFLFLKSYYTKSNIYTLN